MTPTNSMTLLRRTSQHLLRHFRRNDGSLSAAAAAGRFRGTRRDFSAKSPGEDPLELLRGESERRNLCDPGGFRRPGRQWSFALAVASGDAEAAPNLRTMGFQRVSGAGVDFVAKRGPHSDLLASCRPASILYSVGNYRPGELVEQWRADGHCEGLELGDIIDKVPRYTITEMVSSVRAADEMKTAAEDSGSTVSKDRMLMGNQSHFTEMVQKTRIELENGDISDEELENCLKAWRFLPDRMERMVGGPDHIMWDRWEWIRTAGDCPEGTGPWREAQHILPY